jgi:CDP-glucose 4,6-dehydratase
MLLKKRGHEVSGISLNPVPNSLFTQAKVASLLEHDIRLDIRDRESLRREIGKISPDVVMHLAAQPLVRYSYREPRETFETNVNGTLNVLEAVQETPSVKACLVVTTDKVYRNMNQVEGYTETDALGGEDPYSASKAMADILTQSWVKSFPGVPTAIARAGNVIGGGDVCEDRLMPDVVRAFSADKPLHIRYPNAVRPWQHVLDCLNGYLILVDALLAGRGEGEWNFGPGEESFVPVERMDSLSQELWDAKADAVIEETPTLQEAMLLALDSTKAQSNLGWKNKLAFPACLEWTLSWEQKVLSGANARDECQLQLEMFEAC